MGPESKTSCNTSPAIWRGQHHYADQAQESLVNGEMKGGNRMKVTKKCMPKV